MTVSWTVQQIEKEFQQANYFKEKAGGAAKG